MPTHTNRLARETSPYLLQHQHNPVDWYPWGEEAFERAKRENKPIFLSVGYSTCYWCHVMERQSFEVESIAAVMNELFVCIKVDREERPDVDQLYMTAVQVLTRQGGWPMSVWLTPDRRPFYGGTYFPPTDTQGRPGFVRVCKAIDDAWRNRPTEVVSSTGQIVSMLQRLARPATPSEQISIDPQLVGSFIDRSVADYEPRFGGFGHAPKFPRQTVLELLLAYLHSDLDETATGGKTPKTKVRQMVLHTLDAMMHGGIRDHLGGGFHRYSTDAKWLVPHFEIMLYDNAMLLTCYAEAHRLTSDARYAQVARDIADFVLREMTSPDGAFYTAMDAEVDHQEGLNYLWKPQEIEAVLGVEEGRRFNRIYGLDLGPNFADPHHGSGVAERNILFIAEPGNAVEDAPSPLLNAELATLRKKLLESRHTRKQPLLDTKILTSWNALMIRGLAVAGRILAEERYVEAAAKASSFLLSCHRTNEGGLYRTSRDGVLKYRAFLDDYAYLAWALTDLATASTDPRWTAEAQRLLEVMGDRFGDDTLGGFYFTDRLADDLFIRQKTSQDSPLPSGNAAAALALTALQEHDAARRTIAVFSQPIVEHCEAMGSMVQAAMLSMLASGPFKIDVEVVDEEDVVLSEDVISATPTSAKDVVQLSAAWVSAVELQVRVSIKSGWHINAHDLPAGSGLSPTALHVSPVEGVGNIAYPTGRLFQPDASLPAIHVYENEATISVVFAAESDQKGVELTLSYQPCNESTCLAPATARLTVERK